MTDKTDIIKAKKDLDAARAIFNEAHREYERQRSVRTDALNSLNNAQREFDKAVEAERKLAEWDSDWHSRNQIRQQA